MSPPPAAPADGTDGASARSNLLFLDGCGLPHAWHGAAQWRVLDTGFGTGLKFLATWQAWKQDPRRAAMLHYVAIVPLPPAGAELPQAAAADPGLLPLARQLQAQWTGLLPGFHRLAFEGGHVLLTVCVGDVQRMLREQRFEADGVYLDDAGSGDPHILKAVARCCRRGTRIASGATGVRDGLAQCGFRLDEAPAGEALRGVFDPRWEPKKRRQAAPGACAAGTGTAIVIGGGIAGAAVAASLARRGRHVRVLDAAPEPAGGASGLPAGLFAPHVSPDDSVLSRLSRAGVRATMLQAGALLREGRDWQPGGVLEHRIDSSAGLAADAPPASRDWSREADAAQLAQAGLDAGETACWHAQAGWIRPKTLVAALLSHPAITWRGGAAVASLRGDAGGWQVLDAAGTALAQADLVVVAAGPASAALLARAGCAVPLQPVRGQLSWALRAAGAPALAPFPVNGHGSLIPSLPREDGASAWVTGATFERDSGDTRTREADDQANLARLRELLPAAAHMLAPEFAQGSVRSWAGIRCASPDRLPLAGPVDPAALPGLYACTAMGSRGLTLSMLCAELVAALVHGEPLPLEAKLAQALAPGRFG